MTNSPLWLSQALFFFSLGFLGLFLLTQTGLSWVLVYFKLRGRGGVQSRYVTAYRFWVRVFALCVILVMASVVPVFLQFGSLWPGLMAKIGNVASPLLALTLLVVFPFKACFLGPMLFGQRRMSDTTHGVMVLLVALGSTLTLLVVLVFMAWLQVPVGASLAEGEFEVSDWVAIILNPVLGGYVAVAFATATLIAGFMLMGVTARQSLHHVIDEADRSVFKTGLTFAVAGSVAMVAALAVYSAQVAAYQPAKAAATAAYWVSGSSPDLVLVAFPSETQTRNLGAVSFPGLARPWLGADEIGAAVGLDKYAGMHAPVGATFWSWRLLALSVAVLFFASWMTFLYLRGRVFELAALPMGWRRLLSGSQYAGWLVAGLVLAHVGFGQLPWVVYGSVTVSEVLASHAPDVLFMGLLAQVVVSVLLMAGFIQLLNYSVRYGVVPVARRRGRA